MSIDLFHEVADVVHHVLCGLQPLAKYEFFDAGSVVNFDDYDYSIEAAFLAPHAYLSLNRGERMTEADERILRSGIEIAFGPLFDTFEVHPSIDRESFYSDLSTVLFDFLSEFEESIFEQESCEGDCSSCETCPSKAPVDEPKKWTVN